MPEKNELVPAVPAQEAPRCLCPVNWFETKGFHFVSCPLARPAEPQAGAQPEEYQRGYRAGQHDTEDHTDRLNAYRNEAGAQVPSQDDDRVSWLKKLVLDFAEQLTAAEAHLNTIKSYAIEAAKTPITREDMHDPLKAQTFFDEAKGFERLVLSETGGSK